FTLFFFFFFFQAEDGIRDLIVTGVQTCALPILNDLISWPVARATARERGLNPLNLGIAAVLVLLGLFRSTADSWGAAAFSGFARSEERRVGKEWRSRWWREHDKKNA